MKKLLGPILLLGLLGIVVYKLDIITNFTTKVISTTPEVTIDKPNNFMYDKDYIYIQKSKDFVPYSKQDIINIFYSIFDNGYDTFTFYCPSEYTDCLKDVEELTNDQTIITDIGNFVHPYNNFSDLEVVTDSLGEIDVLVNRSYTEEMKNAIDTKLNQVFTETLTSDMDIHDKILAMHDYVIDNVVYDKEDSKNSGNAYGALIEGKAKCAGYADIMAIILAKLGVQNYKVASEKHVWNAIYLDNEWSHVDLTWDDPIVEDGAIVSDTIRHKFYMINTETLQSYDTEEHDFNKNIYVEVR